MTRKKTSLRLRIRRGNLAPWMKTAKGELGQKEIAGPAKNDRIVNDYFKAASFGGKDDSGGVNAWCASFVAFVMKQHGYAPPGYAYRALSWKNFGQSRAHPTYGTICVKTRNGGGHVGFAIGGNAAKGKLYLLGGNQNNEVNVTEYDQSLFTGFYLPTGYVSNLDWLPHYTGVSAARGLES